MLRTIFICIVLCVGTYGATRSRLGALLFYLWFAFFRPQEWVFFDLAALHLSFIIAVLLIGPALFKGVWPNLNHPLSFGMLLFLMMTLLAQVGAVSPEIGWHWIDYMTRLILVSLLAISIIRTRWDLLLVVGAIAGSLGFHAAKAGLASLTGGGLQFADGLAGPWVDNNGYAIAGAMVIYPLIAFGQNIEERWVRYGCYAAACLTVFTVISTFSREGFLALTVATLTFLLLQRRRLVAVTAFTLAVLVGLAVVPIPDRYLDRIKTIRTYREVGDDSALSRLHFWQVGLNMALDRPFGVGLRNFDEAFDSYDFLQGRFGTHRSVHSSHIQVLAETGFPGEVVWLSLLGGSYLIGLRVRSRGKRAGLDTQSGYFDFTIANALMASMSAFIVGGSFIALALNDLTWLTFALFAALDRVSRSAVHAGADIPCDVAGARLTVADVVWKPAVRTGRFT